MCMWSVLQGSVLRCAPQGTVWGLLSWRYMCVELQLFHQYVGCGSSSEQLMAHHDWHALLLAYYQVRGPKGQRVKRA